MNRKNDFLLRRFGMEALGDDAPAISLALGRKPAAHGDYVVELPFRRSVPVILIAALFLVVFSVPLFTLQGFLAGADDGSLFSLVFKLFTLFWMLGWSTGVALLLLLFLCLLMGGETLQASSSRLCIRIGIPGIALAVSYSPARIRDFRYIEADIDAARKWRGPHIAFDYSGKQIGVGSALDGHAAQAIVSRLRGCFPLHDAPPPSGDAAAEADATRDAAAATSRPPGPAAAADSPLRWNSVSVIALVCANLIPLAGVLLADWNIGDILLLFWAESAIIGYYNLCKMGKVGGWSLLFYGPFFLGHYGAFMVVHLLFIYALFGGDIASDAQVSYLQVWNDLLGLWPALLGLLISHSISYYWNFVVAEKYRGRSMSFQMQEPYRRILIMHLTIILGGFLTLALGSGVGALMLLLGLKIGADLRGHLSQHAS